MMVYVKLYSVLRMGLERYDADRGIELKLENRGTIKDLLDVLGIRPEDAKMVYVNNRLAGRLDCLLEEGDTVGIFPAIPHGG